VGRVWPRHGHRGRPLNSVVRRHQKRVMRQITIFACTVAALSIPIIASATSAEAMIYRAIFETFGEPNRTFVVRDTPPRPAMPSASTREFETLRIESVHLANDFDGVRVRLLPEVEYRAFFSSDCRDGWRAFHSRYPEAKVLIGISHVLFRSNQRAAVYFESNSGCLGGGGVLFNLENESGRWKVKGQEHLWIS